MLITYIINIEKNLNHADFYYLLSQVSEDKQKSIGRYRRREDAQRSLLGDVLRRYAVCKRLNAKNSDLVFSFNDFGKPLLENSPDLFFNISHSQSWIICALDDQPVGVDVEVIRPIDLQIASRFFSKKEAEIIMRLPEQNRLEYFYKIWTLKESYIKAIGKGLSIPLDSFSILIEESNIRLQSGLSLAEYFFSQNTLSGSAIYALCSHHNNVDKNIIMSSPELIQLYKDFAI